ncbi:nucleotide exchange factor GrpE [Pelagovum pacificum]|uniref:Protein GrpE n=1 Tax=Pelagovum pacificum TaxID=2588711 RepID=A0A5C5GKX4_9RHOB|nr:nucleotide exchange factor GrpE [Pelagovum pacificum]QQA42786.1 nucleotide exchange factor GrpE [Pelagovum pacificum]TNY34066.1 nucleotide exchange factor GrpE [Pelagovum pacificum]
MAKPKSEQEFMEEVAAELRGESEPTDGVEESDAPETAADPDELETLRAERDELKDRFVRALADAENTRKRADRDRREAENYGGSKLARDMLPVYDNLSRALETANEEQKEISKSLLEGVELTMKELLNVFKKHGIEPIAPEVGEKFDPQEHQAMFEAPVPGTTAGEIIQVMATGFMLHDRLLRPAQVGVSSTPAS